jgi:hypothetical protein
MRHWQQLRDGLGRAWAVVASRPHAVVVLAVMVGQVQQAAACSRGAHRCQP